MSDSTDVNREHSGAPRLSRREQRKAERAAEREAYLTGQQPLLTRREMRRLQEEAEALREAIAAGELTEEEARALQDPTYEGENLAVLAGVVPGEEPVVSVEHDEDDELTDVEPSEPDGLTVPDVAESSVPAAPEPVESFRAEPVESHRAEPVEAYRAEPVEAYRAEPVESHRAEPEEPVAQPPGPVLPELPEPVRPKPVDSMVPDLVLPTAPAPHGTGASHRTGSQTQRDTSRDEDARIDDAPLPAQQGAEGYSSDEVEAIAAVETGVLDAVDLTAVDDAGSGAVGAGSGRPGVPERRSLFGAASHQHDAPLATGLPVAGSPDRGAGLEDAASSDSLFSPYGVASPDGFTSPVSASSGGETEAPSPTPLSPSSPARRPIVRIPSTVQGVRTVDRDTGELSSVQPVDDEFSGIDNPQWKALRDADESDVAETEYVSAPTPEEPAAPAELDEAESDEDVKELTTAVVEEGKGRGVRRTLLIALVVLVLVLVLATIVWFVLVRGGNVFAVSAFLHSLQPLIL